MRWYTHLIVYLCCILCLQGIVLLWATNGVDFGWNTSYSGPNKHIPAYISAPTYRMLDNFNNQSRFIDIVNQVAIERLPNTPGHSQVRDYIIDILSTLEWKISLDEFTASTPVGEVPYTNIVATLNPNAPQQLVLAAHYETKYFPPPSKFIGATDAAVSVAILLELAVSLTPLINNGNYNDMGLVLIFTDGEEAWEEWTETDSIYGAKHLASVMEQRNELKSINLFVLLDLIGEAKMQFHSHFSETQRPFNRMVKIEQRLRKGKKPMFSRGSPPFSALDDHIPFQRKNVPILHLISIPFPSAWHTDQDTLDIVDFDTVMEFISILRVFVCEYLHVY